MVIYINNYIFCLYLSNLSFINIKNIENFISEIQTLHHWRQRHEDVKNLYTPQIEPGDDFFDLIQLLLNSSKDDFSPKSKKIVLNQFFKI